MTIKKFIRSFLYFGILGSSITMAQEFPSKTITIVSPFSPGGNTDLRARQIATPLSVLLGKPVIVENKPGASGNIGTEYIAKANPDGYTLGIGSMGPLAVNGAIYPKIGFDPLKDFSPIILIEKAPLILVTKADSPLNSIQDIVNVAKKNPTALSIGNAGTGGAHHLSAEMLKKKTGIQILSVPYKGGGPASIALQAGEIDLMFEQTYAALPNIKAGKVKALAVTSEKRLPSLPEVPTMAELGYKDLIIYNWLGMIAPKNTPTAVVNKLNVAINKVLSTPDMKEKIVDPGNIIGGGSPQDYAKFIASENKRWTDLIKSIGTIKVE
jgi:tripartite-type tricarboxylate transporter receptor subunit TctC